MKFIFLFLMPLLLSAATREECAERLKRFAPLEKAYDAVVAAGIASPISEKVIRDFRTEGNGIYTDCKDKMSTTPWYMLGKKVQADDVKVEQFHMESAMELRSYAISHPPVIVNTVCGTVTPGANPPRR